MASDNSNSQKSASWFRFGVSLAIAVILASILFLLPIVRQEVQIPLQTENSSVELSLPFGVVPVYATGGLTVTKTALSSVKPGELLTYTLRVVNNTGGTLSTVVVGDNLPTYVTCYDGESAKVDGIYFTSSSCSGNEAQWIASSLPNGVTVDLTLIAQVDAEVTGANVINNDYYVVSITPEFSDQGPSVSTAIEYPPTTLSISKIGSPNPVTVNGDITYLIQITNTGQNVAKSVSIVDALPAEVSYQSHRFVDSVAGSSSVNSNQVTWTLDNDLAIQESVRVEVIGKMGTTIPSPATITNNYNASASNANTVSGQLVTGVEPGDPSMVSLSLSSSSISLCAVFEATATLTDQYGNPVSGKTLEISEFGTSRLTALNGTSGTTDSSGQVVLSFRGDSEGDGTLLANYTEGSISSPQKTVNISAPAVPSQITLTVPTELPAGGESVNVTATLNSCSIPVPNETIEFSLNDYSLGSISPVSGVTDANGQVVATVTSTSTILTDILKVRAEYTSLNLRDTQSISIVAPSLSILKVADPVHSSVVNSGGTINYTLRVTNTGSYQAANLSLTDLLPDSVSYVSHNSTFVGTGGTVSGPIFSGNQLTLSLSQLEEGATWVATIATQVASQASGTINNSATVSSAKLGPVTSNTVTHVIVLSNKESVYLPLIMK